MNDPRDSLQPRPSPSAFRRLLQRRVLARVLFAFVCLATLAGLFLTVQNLRSARAQEKAAGGTLPENAEIAAIIPPPIPDEENFAAIPFFEALFGTNSSHKPDPRRWPDDYDRAVQIATEHETDADRNNPDRKMTDLAAWQFAFQTIGDDGTNPANAASEPDRKVDRATAAAAILQALKVYDPVLDEMRAASHRPGSRFNVRYDLENPWGILLPHLRVIRGAWWVLKLRAAAELAAGQTAPALEDVKLMLRLVESIQGEPMLISQMVRVAGLSLSTEPIWEGLAQRKWPDAALQELQTRLGQFDLLADLKQAFRAERAWGNLTVSLVRNKRKADFSLSLLSTGRPPEPWKTEANSRFKTCPLAWFDEERRNYNRLFDLLYPPEFDAQARRVFPRKAEENEKVMEQALANTSTLLTNHLVMAMASLIPPAKPLTKCANAQCVVDQALIGCALERFHLAAGQYPETLAALAPRFIDKLPRDVISGELPKYRRTEDGRFVLYSVGWNETDDGGVIAVTKDRVPRQKVTEGDWVWQYPAK